MIGYHWYKLSDSDLTDVAFGNKSDLERTDMYGLIEELAIRLRSNDRSVREEISYTNKLPRRVSKNTRLARG